MDETEPPIISLFLMLFWFSNILYISPASGLHHASCSGAVLPLVLSKHRAAFFSLSVNKMLLFMMQLFLTLGCLWYTEVIPSLSSLKLTAESTCRWAVQSHWPGMTTLMNPLIFSSGKWTLFFLNLHFAALAFTGIIMSINFSGASSVWLTENDLSICKRDYNLHYNIIHNLPSTV